MKIICSWCRRDGHHDLVGEKPPLEDHRETHGICTTHRLAVQARWNDLRIGPQLISVGSESDPSRSDAPAQVAPPAATLWVCIRNFTRKAGL